MKKYGIVLVTFIITLIVGILVIFLLPSKKESKMLSLSNKIYNLAYDDSWKVISENTNSIILEHGLGSTINININDIDSNNAYKKIEEIIDDIVYKINSDNKDYNLIKQNKEIVNKSNIYGYKLLYENKDKELLVTIYKKNNRLVVIYYEANIEYFDALLDSVNNIIYNFNVEDYVYDIKQEINIKTEKIKFDANEDIDKLIDKNSKRKIVNNHYIVNYEVPDFFTLSSINSSYEYLYYSKDSSRLEINTSIKNTNMYTYLNVENSSSIYSNYNSYRKSEDTTSFMEQIEKINEDNYIYRNKIEYKMFGNKESKMEFVQIVYTLDNNHIFIVEISARNMSISKKLVDSIKLIDYKSFSKYIINNIDSDNNNIREFKVLKNVGSNKYYNIILKMPLKYEEIDQLSTSLVPINLFENRKFGYKYNKEKEFYYYNVEYNIFNYYDLDESIDKRVKIYDEEINKNIGPYEDFTKVDDLTINSKTFKAYTGKYTKNDGIIFTGIVENYSVNKMILFYPFSDNKIFEIKIDAIEQEITQNMLEEITNYIIEEKEF